MRGSKVARNIEAHVCILHVCKGESIRAGCNVRFGFRACRREGKAMGRGGEERAGRDIFMGSYAGVEASRSVISTFSKARKGSDERIVRR